MAYFQEAELYMKLSQDHVVQAAQILNSFQNFLKCKPGETVLDVGCGPGVVTTKVILPSLHPEFSSVVGIDISKEMINFAKRTWSDEGRLHFVTMDIAEEDSGKIETNLPVQEFDKIFSFFALQWVTNRRQWANNLKKLLAPGGQALLLLVVNSGVYEVWDTLAKSSKWEKYTQNVNVPLNEYQYLKNPGDVISKCIISAGLELISLQTQFHRNAFSSNITSDADKIAKLKSVDPLVGNIPKDLHDEYLYESLAHTKKLAGPNGAVDYTSVTLVCQKSRD